MFALLCTRTNRLNQYAMPVKATVKEAVEEILALRTLLRWHPGPLPIPRPYEFPHLVHTLSSPPSSQNHAHPLTPELMKTKTNVASPHWKGESSFWVVPHSFLFVLKANYTMAHTEW